MLGVNAFAARLPSWLATAGTIWLLAAYACSHYGKRVAKRAALIYCTCSLVYVLSGAVLTDPFLVLGTTWAMTSLPMARSEEPTSELQSLMRNSYAVFCLTKKTHAT